MAYKSLTTIKEEFASLISKSAENIETLKSNIADAESRLAQAKADEEDAILDGSLEDCNTAKATIESVSSEMEFYNNRLKLLSNGDLIDEETAKGYIQAIMYHHNKARQEAVDTIATKLKEIENASASLDVTMSSISELFSIYRASIKKSDPAPYGIDYFVNQFVSNITNIRGYDSFISESTNESDN